jgi:hypothetical protein
MARHHLDLVPGQRVGISKEDPSMVILVDVPDTVRMPVELGGEEVHVVGHQDRGCPCGCGAQVRVLHLDNGVHVAGCPARGFLWYRPGG